MAFLALPDTPAAEALVREATGAPGVHVVPHASGRPWLVGHWAEEDACLVSAGRSRQLAVIGHGRPDPHAAEKALARARVLEDLDGIARTLPGSHHLIACIDGRSRVQGAVSTARQVYLARTGGVTVAAGSPAPLLELLGARIDEDVLALHLLGTLPAPLTQRSIWSGIHLLPARHWLELGREGGSRAVSWWTPPPPALPLAQAVEATASALHEAVAARLRPGRPVSADLSGGLDSTGLCFLAHAAGAQLITHHWKSRDVGNDDTEWARLAAAALPDAHHRFLPLEDSPTWFDASAGEAGTAAVPLDVEGPLQLGRNRANSELLARAARDEGATAHLAGVGGDDLFGATPIYPWWLARAHPFTGLPALHRIRVMNHWAVRPTVRALCDRATPAQWLAASAARITLPHARESRMPLEWRGDSHIAPWATPRAVSTAARLVRESAALQPRVRHHTAWLQHFVVETAARSGQGIRQLSHAMTPFGVGFEAPYLDDRVLEAALSARVDDRMGRLRFKPLLTAALRGVVPDASLARVSKGEYGAEMYAGLRRNRRRLLELCDDLHLARLGLVDAEALRSALLHLGPETQQVAPFEATLACENWLRSPGVPAPAAPAPSPLPAGGTR
ncbi:asparagine synthase-related protein [Streptomyces iconiensis]|uniref:asparagine synthase (glutamine-hydrolyzing) n=1 Tax=Streptomyces iconiensis TaxID=1384038 RepID=A0ABT7A1Q2_9ACTN|nr:asparagine synthase-related protein [Streptomyces iconiensis]MDJ1135247.1 asparagine synthase-related protein [Streptomyces iconiensis]